MSSLLRLLCVLVALVSVAAPVAAVLPLGTPVQVSIVNSAGGLVSNPQGGPSKVVSFTATFNGNMAYEVSMTAPARYLSITRANSNTFTAAPNTYLEVEISSSISPFTSATLRTSATEGVTVGNTNVEPAQNRVTQTATYIRFNLSGLRFTSSACIKIDFTNTNDVSSSSSSSSTGGVRRSSSSSSSSSTGVARSSSSSSTAGAVVVSSSTLPPPVLTSSSSTGGAVVGDPQFFGFLGQSYQVHGAADTNYNVISSEKLQLNAFFVYLSEGNCRDGTECFGHPGNYFGAVALLIEQDNGKVLKLHIASGAVDEGLTVTLDGAPLLPSASQLDIDSTNSLKFSNKFDITCVTRDFVFTFQNSDRFLNQEVGLQQPLLQQVRAYSLQQKTGQDTSALVAQLPHGILGQTWRMMKYPNRWRYIEADLMDYVLPSIEATPTVFNRFQLAQAVEATA